MRKSKKRTARIWIGISAGFVGIMLMVTAALYMSGSDEITIESRNLKADTNYTLDQNEAVEVYNPVG